jgi:hypothetical protein
MKFVGFKSVLRIIGVLLLPFSFLFFAIALGLSTTKAQDPGVPQILMGFLLLGISIYLLAGGPGLGRMVDWRRGKT